MTYVNVCLELISKKYEMAHRSTDPNAIKMLDYFMKKKTDHYNNSINTYARVYTCMHHGLDQSMHAQMDLLSITVLYPLEISPTNCLHPIDNASQATSLYSVNFNKERSKTINWYTSGYSGTCL